MQILGVSWKKMTKIPFSILPPNVLNRVSQFFMGFAEIISKRFKFLKEKLEQAEFDISPEEYLAKCITATLFLLIVLSFVFPLLVFSKSETRISTGILCALIVSALVFFNQINYPKSAANKRVKEIDKNLLPALNTILIQINSGVSLFDVIVYISTSDYGEISKIFNKMVRKINTGKPQIEAIEEIVKNNPSDYFRKSIWQLINGMKSGSDISKVLSNIIDSLSKEQIIQIENYGSQLNPLAMFYMLVVIIIPSLGVTFMTVISSFFSSGLDNKTLLIGLFIFVLIFQIVFLGLIKTKRPSLLGD